MKDKLWKQFFLFFLIVFSLSTFAQVTLNVSADINPQNISLSEETPVDGENAYWDNGFTFGIDGGYFLSQNFLLSASFNYSHYDFDKYVFTGFAIPESHYTSSVGEDSKIIRVSCEAKYFPFPNEFKFFILSGLGYVTEILGEVRATFQNMLENSETTYIIKQDNQNRLAHSLGIGFRTNIFSNVHVELSYSYYSNYSDWFQSIIGFGLGYNLH